MSHFASFFILFKQWLLGWILRGLRSWKSIKRIYKANRSFAKFNERDHINLAWSIFSYKEISVVHSCMLSVHTMQQALLIRILTVEDAACKARETVAKQDYIEKLISTFIKVVCVWKKNFKKHCMVKISKLTCI